MWVPDLGQAYKNAARMEEKMNAQKWIWKETKQKKIKTI